MKKLHGIVPALVAPQDENNEIQFDALGKLAQREVADGANGFLVNGHSGELAITSGEERVEALKTVRAAVGPDIGILAGVHTQGMGAKFAAHAKSAADCGADAVLVFSPFSFARGAFAFAPEAVIDYYRQAAKLSPVPIYFMQYRPQTNLMMPRHVLQEVAAIPNVGGIKQEVEDAIEYERDFFALREANPDLTILTATDRSLLSNYVVGADGCTIGLANFVKPVKAIQDAVWANDMKAAKQASLDLIPLADAIYGPPSYRWSARLKYALYAAGFIPSPSIRSPLFEATEKERKNIDAIIAQYLN